MGHLQNETSNIIARIKSGEKAAFDILVDRYKYKAFSIAFRISRNVEDAKDLVQEAFVKAYISIENFKEESSFYTWFYRILINVAMDYTRRRAKEDYLFNPLETVAEDNKLSLSEKLASPSLGPDKLTVGKEIKQVTETAVALLPPQQKLVFNLRHYEGLKFEDIAKILNCGVSTAKVNFFKAIRNLRKHLAPYIED